MHAETMLYDLQYVPKEHGKLLRGMKENESFKDYIARNESILDAMGMTATARRAYITQKSPDAGLTPYELLKNNMQFNKEIYKQALIKHEELKLEVSQNAKHLITISSPTLADSYSYPNKVWDLFTLFIILIFLYNILITIIGIIEDHKD